MDVSVKSMGLTNDEGNITKAIATICLDNAFNIEGVTVKRSKDNNLYVQLPQKIQTDKETGDKKYKDACYPITKELRDKINSALIDTYNQKLQEREEVQKKTNNVAKSKKKTKEKEVENEEEESI